MYTRFSATRPRPRASSPNNEYCNYVPPSQQLTGHLDGFPRTYIKREGGIGVRGGGILDRLAPGSWAASYGAENQSLGVAERDFFSADLDRDFERDLAGKGGN